MLHVFQRKCILLYRSVGDKFQDYNKINAEQGFSIIKGAVVYYQEGGLGHLDMSFQMSPEKQKKNSI